MALKIKVQKAETSVTLRLMLVVQVQDSATFKTGRLLWKSFSKFVGLFLVLLGLAKFLFYCSNISRYSFVVQTFQVFPLFLEYVELPYFLYILQLSFPFDVSLLVILCVPI